MAKSMTSHRYEVAKIGQAKSGERQPKLKTSQRLKWRVPTKIKIMRGHKPKLKSNRD